MRARTCFAAALTVAALIAAGCGSDDDSAASLEVSGAYIPVPAGDNGALYFEVTNDGGAVELAEVRSDVAETVTVHETVRNDDGLMEMRAIEGALTFDSGTTSFEPGGVHVMLIGVSELAVGDQVPFELVLADDSTIDVEAEVVETADDVHVHDDGEVHDHSDDESDDEMDMGDDESDDEMDMEDEGQE